MVAQRPTPISLNLSRTFPATRERVFRAWTDAEEIRQWWGPGDYTAPHAEVDLRVGGRYRIGLRSPEGETIYVGGVYREVAAPERLVFTWQWEPTGEPDEAPSPETLVTLEFRERGRETEVVLTHERFTDPEDCERHESGWAATLDKLPAMLGGRPPNVGRDG